MTHTETIIWRPVAPESMPDADLVVNVATVGSEEPVWLGAFDGEVWRDTEGMQIDVTHWAPMLAGPHGVTGRNNCATCDHKKHPDGGHCYMFRTEPDGVCMKHTVRTRGVTGTQAPSDAPCKAHHLIACVQCTSGVQGTSERQKK